jgi:hypothetical protein
LILLFFLSSCSESTPQWQSDLTFSDCPVNPCSHFSFQREVVGNSICLRVVNGNYGVRVYADSKVRNFPSDPKDSSKTAVKLTIGDTTTSYSAERLSGGQRLVLPEEATDAVIDALAQQKSFTLTCGFSSIEVGSAGFADAYDRIRRERSRRRA